MRTISLSIIFIMYSLAVRAQIIQEQFASSVIAFSSQYNTSNYSANEILGAPNRYPACSGGNVWSMATENSGFEFIEVAFATPQPANTIKVYQTSGAGGITSLQVRALGTSTWTTVYTATAAADGCGKLLEVTFPTTG